MKRSILLTSALLMLSGCTGLQSYSLQPQSSSQDVASLKEISVQLDGYFNRGFPEGDKRASLPLATDQLRLLAREGHINQNNRDEWLKLVTRAYRLANHVAFDLKNPKYFPQENRIGCMIYSVAMKDMISSVARFAAGQSCEIQNELEEIDKFNASVADYTQYIGQFYDLNKAEDREKIIWNVKYDLSQWPEVRDAFFHELGLYESFKMNN
ncbi:membrane lipoprotein lipid attachment site-containing protein [Neisseria wadsworthii]|uniref:membrane lipoprotein lipid attachment site-containing protein n=1 Tax=Neisseria wadsworthii TaxID=607711 RepID=UPI0012EAEFD6|nr:membrane lipoprotein lipid attachment site-containing protein [Neisseria wadsworthii]QMT34748.1 membrane lipoprotein lipid attachment site-containing protein [Neisseria wadsworthii]